MLDYLESLPRQVRDAFLIGSSVRIPKKQYAQVKQVLYCGMGGSGISGDLLKIFFDRNSKKPWTVLRDSVLPAWVDASTLVVLSSYSGNTLEIRSIFREAKRRKVPVLVQTAGGWLARACSQEKDLRLDLPVGFPPRCAIGYLTFSLLAFFLNAGWIDISPRELEEAFDMAEKFPRKAAKSLAEKFLGKNVRFYGSRFLEPVALRWKTQFAENAKVLSGYGGMPEIFHHEVEGWHDRSAVIRNSIGVFFTDASDPKWLVKKRAVAVEWMKKSGAQALVIPAEGKGVLAKLISLVMLGDWTSYELALLNKEDPLAIRVIERIKACEKTA